MGENAVDEFTKSYDGSHDVSIQKLVKQHRPGWKDVVHWQRQKVKYLNMFPRFIPNTKDDVTILEKRFRHFWYIQCQLLMENHPADTSGHYSDKAHQQVDAFLQKTFVEYSRDLSEASAA